MFYLFFLLCDIAEDRQIFFQDTATPVMTGILDLYDYVCFFLIFIFIIVAGQIYDVLIFFRFDKTADNIFFNLNVVKLFTESKSKKNIATGFFFDLPENNLSFNKNNLILDFILNIKKVFFLSKRIASFFRLLNYYIFSPKQNVKYLYNLLLVRYLLRKKYVENSKNTKNLQKKYKYIILREQKQIIYDKEFFNNLNNFKSLYEIVTDTKKFSQIIALFSKYKAIFKFNIIQIDRKYKYVHFLTLIIYIFIERRIFNVMKGKNFVKNIIDMQKRIVKFFM